MYEVKTDMKERILEILNSERNPMSEEKLLQLLALPVTEVRSYNEAVEELRENDILFLTSNKYLALSSRYRRGTVGLRHNGSFYIVPEEPGLPEAEGVNNDRFVLYPGDLVRYDPRNGKVYQLLEHRLTNVIVTRYRRSRGWFFVCDDILPEDFKVVNEREYRKADGVVFGCRISDYNRRELTIEAVLNAENRLDFELNRLAYKADLYNGFPEEVNRQKVERILPQERRDLGGQLCVTIDGDDAKDYDDGIAVVKQKSGFVLYVHIADVSFYVKEGTPIDREALRRGTTVYLPGRVYPMLPEILSNDLCSLLPGEKRAAVTCEIHYDSRGKRRSFKVYPALICSKRRLTYSFVNRVLEEKESIEEELGSMLKDAAELASLLQEHAKEAGRLMIPEQELEFTIEEGKVTDVFPRRRGTAEKLIESFMIEANGCVDELLTEKGIAHFSRNHGSPDLAKLEEFFLEVEARGYLCTEEDPRQEILGALDFLAENEENNWLCNLLLRAQAKAKYMPVSRGHYALALEHYCHFTSPIRRYPDLQVHRALHRHVFRDEKAGDERSLDSITAQVNQKEADAVKTEREADRIVSCIYMEERHGAWMNATVSSIQPYGMYLMLENGIEVFAGSDLIRDEKGFRTGQHIRVQILGVDWLHKRVEVFPSPKKKGL